MSEVQNALEIAFMQAVREPASRPGFYKLLLESDIYIIGKTDAEGQGETVLQPDVQLSIFNWKRQDGTPVIPFFSSLPMLQKTLQQESGYVALSAKAMFEMTRGTALIFNPGSDYPKEFEPGEIDALLETGVNHVAQQRVVQKPTQVMLGQPAKYPSQMMDALSTLLARHASVKAAYLGLMHDREHDAAPTLIIGFLGDGDVEIAMKEAGSVAADTAPEGVPVDFMCIAKGEGGVSDYFLQSVKPFYERSLGAKLRGLFGSRA
ncbi:enhanced serine sensitivity protein SseB [Herminiimonas sp. KBW02]|uniref:enhanced serine sensitivity protein SseB C-terminal domain-containing protein n=1 Tax=Herminiimonas sp. KBW02 TaxID=2153363 RepID=UPI000F5B44ED|nr:enhanced serine sensitivity protein SseB C-terminal domain-containing protein [Herminiimonas sp. KBW02]RQO34848.1 enhanced serine sensitivity protein SseB [Herminiimonas sp. KBW02]